RRSSHRLPSCLVRAVCRANRPFRSSLGVRGPVSMGDKAAERSYHARALPKKSRTPPPPKRPVQAPRVRTAERDPRRGRVILYAPIAAGLAILGIVAAAFAFSGGGNGSGAEDAITALRDAGCTYQNPPPQGRTHVSALPKGFKANTVPRSSGPHSPQTIFYGAYTDEVPELNAVHNLEHGAVILYYGPKVPKSTADRMARFSTEAPEGFVVSKHSKLGADVAYVPWARVARFSKVGEELAPQLIHEVAFKGPDSS